MLEKPELSSGIDLMTIKANIEFQKSTSVNFLTTIALLHCTKNEEILNEKLSFLCSVRHSEVDSF